MFQGFQHPTWTATDPGNSCTKLFAAAALIPLVSNLPCDTAASGTLKASLISRDRQARLDES